MKAWLARLPQSAGSPVVATVVAALLASSCMDAPEATGSTAGHDAKQVVTPAEFQAAIERIRATRFVSLGAPSIQTAASKPLPTGYESIEGREIYGYLQGSDRVLAGEQGRRGCALGPRSGQWLRAQGDGLRRGALRSLGPRERPHRVFPPHEREVSGISSSSRTRASCSAMSALISAMMTRSSECSHRGS